MESKQIRNLGLLTFVIAFAPLLRTLVVAPEGFLIESEEITPARIASFDESQVVAAMTNGKALSRAEEKILRGRLDEIQNVRREKAISDAKDSCDGCYQSVQKLITKLEDSEGKAINAAAAAKRASRWVFCITFLGIFIVLTAKLRKARIERARIRRRSESLLAYVEWFFAASILIITNPWLGIF